MGSRIELLFQKRNIESPKTKKNKELFLFLRNVNENDRSFY